MVEEVIVVAVTEGGKVGLDEVMAVVVMVMM